MSPLSWLLRIAGVALGVYITVELPAYAGWGYAMIIYLSVSVGYWMARSVQ